MKTEEGMTIEWASTEDLVLDPINARLHNDKNLEAIKGSLARFGQQKPIVIGKANVVIAGNGTLQAAKALKWKKIQVVRTDLEGSELTAFGLADNRTAELATWDGEVLQTLLDALVEDDFPIYDIGFDPVHEDITDLDPEPEISQPKEFLVVVECIHELQQKELLSDLNARGLSCKLL